MIQGAKMEQNINVVLSHDIIKDPLNIGKCAKINETTSMRNTRKLMTTIKVPFITFSIEL
jgi:hypothetical protein